jgi:cyclic dehypoxanthinyl futalosine synthase
MNVSDLLHRALRLEWLTPEEGVFLFENAATAELMYVGNALRQHHVPGDVVTCSIDRPGDLVNTVVLDE